MSLSPIKAFITTRLGLRFEGGAGAHLSEALEQRMASVDAISAAAYLERLRADETELHELAGLLTIGETYFYREPQHLRLLTETLAPELLAHRAGAGKARILSVGCSTGEEPYSIAMALRERYGAAAERLFEIVAGDIDRRALEKARAGLYGAFAFGRCRPNCGNAISPPPMVSATKSPIPCAGRCGCATSMRGRRRIPKTWRTRM